MVKAFFAHTQCMPVCRRGARCPRAATHACGTAAGIQCLSTAYGTNLLQQNRCKLLHATTGAYAAPRRPVNAGSRHCPQPRWDRLQFAQPKTKAPLSPAAGRLPCFFSFTGSTLTFTLTAFLPSFGSALTLPLTCFSPFVGSTLTLPLTCF